MPKILAVFLLISFVVLILIVKFIVDYTTKNTKYVLSQIHDQTYLCDHGIAKDLDDTVIVDLTHTPVKCAGLL